MKRNILANLIGRLWSTLSNFIFIPIIVAILGVNNFGIVTLGVTIASFLTLLDVGLSPSTMREFARKDVDEEERYRAYVTLERLYGILAGVIILMTSLGSGYLAHEIHSAKTPSVDILHIIFILIGCEAAIQLMTRYYVNGLLGLKRHITANVVNVGWSLLRNGFSVLLIWFVPNLLVFIAWQTAATIVSAAAAKVILHREMHPSRVTLNGFLEQSAFARIWGFAFGGFVISLVSTLNTQIDRVAIAGMLPLEELAYYGLAASLGGGILAFSAPLLTSAMPQLIGHCSRGEVKESQQLYRRFQLLIAAVCAAVVATLVVAPLDVLTLWTTNPALAAQVAPILPWSACAFGLVALGTMSYGLALANGDTRILRWIMCSSLLISLPGYFIATRLAGVVGTAQVFLLVQIFTVFTMFWAINRRYLGFSFIEVTILLPLGPALCGLTGALAAATLTYPLEGSWLLIFARLGIIASVASVFAAAGAWGLLKIFEPKI